MKIPYIASDWRVLFRPQIHGDYINDHSVVKGPDGNWHLFGITSFGTGSYQERYFAHGVGPSLESVFEEGPRTIDRGTAAWAPGVIEKDGIYYMFYGPSPTSLAVSFEMYEWFGTPVTLKNEPLMGAHRDHFVLKLDDGSYLMYVVGVHNKRGAMESPYVVKKDGLYYLFITYTDCEDENYNDTMVFCSEDPKNFGNFDGEFGTQPVTVLQAHAPEILEENGKQYITTCGWREKPTPNKGAVSIAELKWKEI